MNAELLGALIVALAGGGALAAIATTVGQRRKVGADATAVVTAAARELVDPLRQELATERREHAAEIEGERTKVLEFRRELAQALEDARALRAELTRVRAELDHAWREIDAQKKRNRELEQQLRKLRST